MAVNKGEIGIYGVLRRDGGNNILARTDQIQDAKTNKTQAEVNQEAFVLSTRIDNINTRVKDLESKISKPINYNNILENKNALDALTGVKHGDMYQVRSAIAINGKKYPKNTKFVYVSTHEDGVSKGWWEPFNSITLSTGASPLLFDQNGNIVMQISTGLTLGGGGQLMVNYGPGLEYTYGELTVSTSRGINVDQGGVHINEGEGINTNDGYLNVNYGKSLTIDDASQKLEVKLDRNSGFYIHESGGLKLGTFGCIEANGISGLNVRVRGGLTIENGQYNDAVIINRGDGLKVNENNELGITLRDGGGLEVDSNGLAVKHGDSLTVGYYNELNLNLVSSPLYMDDYNHISIRCGNGLRIATEYISDFNYNPELCVNYGNTLEMSDDHFLNVNISISTTNNDVAIGLIQSDTQGLYISSSKLAQFIKQVMATP